MELYPGYQRHTRSNRNRSSASRFAAYLIRMFRFERVLPLVPRVVEFGNLHVSAASANHASNKTAIMIQGPVVQSPISANPGSALTGFINS